MTETPPSTTQTEPPRRSITPDWFVHGVLTKIGDTFDRLTGRGYKPTSSLATSELIERLKKLLDAEAKDAEDGKRYVPHNITLKMQWDKFSTDSEDSMNALQNEFLVAVVDHINDKHYYTYQPLNIEIKPDYFTTGVKLFAGFEKFADDDNEAAVNVTVPGLKIGEDIEIPEAEGPIKYQLSVGFELNGQQTVRSLNIDSGSRVSIGRTRENDVAIEDISISKFHASLFFDRNGDIFVADTGSTNGTFVGGERIAYGKSFMVGKSGKVKFGTVNVNLTLTATEPAIKEEPAPTVALPEGAVTVGEFQFRKKTEELTAAKPLPTREAQSTPAPAAQPAPTIEATLDSEALKDVQVANEDWAMTEADVKITEENKAG